MKSLSTIPAATLAALALAAPARADVSVVKDEDTNLKVGAMVQTMGHGEYLNDPVRSDGRAYVFMKEARVRANGTYKDVGMNLELAFGGEDAVAAPSPGISLGLLDLNVDIPLHALGKGSFLKVGQFKVPYGREALTYSGNSLFVDRSLNFLGFQVGRDVGATFNFRSEKASVIAGVFTGGGRDVPQTYIPENLGVPMFTVRAGYGDVDENVYALDQRAKASEGTKWGVSLNGLYTKDTQIGHSTALNVKMANKSLLLNSNWNPYIGKSPMVQGEWWQAGADAALRTGLGQGLALAAEAELNYAEFSNDYGNVHLSGARVQAALSTENFDFGLRYAVLLPTDKFQNNGKQITGNEAINEVTPAISWRVADSLKIVADAPVLLGTPVANEAKIGSYVLTSMPNQSSLMAKDGNTIERQTVAQARLMVQARF